MRHYQSAPCSEQEKSVRSSTSSEPDSRGRRLEKFWIDDEQREKDGERTPDRDGDSKSESLMCENGAGPSEDVEEVLEGSPVASER